LRTATVLPPLRRSPHRAGLRALPALIPPQPTSSRACARSSGATGFYWCSMRG